MFISSFLCHLLYGDTVEQTTCTFSRSIPAKDLGKSRPAQSMGRRWLYIIGDDQAGKRASILLSCISVMDDIKIHEQKSPIAKGPLHVQTEFRAI